MGIFKDKIRRLNVFRTKGLLSDEFERIRVVRRKRVKIPIRFPWEKSAREELQEKKAALAKNPDAFKGGKLMRIKFPEKHHRNLVI